MCANPVYLEECCKMHVCTQLLAFVEPRTSPTMFCNFVKIRKHDLPIPQQLHLPQRQNQEAPRASLRSKSARFRAAGAVAGWCLREGWNLQAPSFEAAAVI